MVRMPIIPEGWLDGGQRSGTGGLGSYADARVRDDVPPLDLNGLAPPVVAPAASPPKSGDPMRNLLDAISNAEGTGPDAVKASGGKFRSGYDVTFGNNVYGAPPKPISEMTLDELDKYQDQVLHHSSNNHPAAPMGTYQIVQTTLRGLRRNMKLSGEERFTPELQDRMAQELVRENGLRAYSAGRITPDKFQDGLATQWDSIADPVTGRTKHGGRLGMTTEQAQALISGFSRGR